MKVDKLINMNLVNNDRTMKIISVVLAVTFGVLFVTLVANAVTTISTAIVTAGNITTSAGNITATAGNIVATAGDLTVGDDATISGGNLTVTTTNAATSTLEVGCIQMYATSTDTAVNLQFHASSTLADSTNGTGDGLVVWAYGSCPI